MTITDRDQMIARLQGRLKELGISENEASQRAKVERTFLSQLRRSKTDRWPTMNKFIAVCDVLGLRMHWVMTGQGRRLIADPDISADVTSVPVLSWVAASSFAEVQAVETLSDLPHVLVPDLRRGDFIALVVQGDSMDRVAPEGATIIIDRNDTALVSRGYYVFSRVQGEEATFKRWMTRPDRLEPFSTNLSHEPILCEQAPDVIGRVRKVMIDI